LVPFILFTYLFTVIKIRIHTPPSLFTHLTILIIAYDSILVFIQIREYLLHFIPLHLNPKPLNPMRQLLKSKLSILNNKVKVKGLYIGLSKVSVTGRHVVETPIKFIPNYF
jgi:hypothetical protein